MLKTLAFGLSFAAITASQEVHNGITYEARFDNTSAVETTPIKDAYETAAAQQATDRLRQALTDTGLAPDCLAANNGTTPADLYAFKDCIVAAEGASIFFTLLADDISESNDFWAQVVAESTTDRSQWVPARAYVRAFFGSELTALEFAAWTQSSQADEANSHANPEHYYKATQITGLTSQASQIFEGWGGVLSTIGTKRTNFTVPEYTIPDFGPADDQSPDAWSLSSDFSPLFHRIGPKVLASGDQTTFGYLQIAVRDVAADAADNDMGIAGIEVYSAVWYPPWDQGTDDERAEFQDNYLADEAHHMVVEVINLTQQAYQDCSVLGIISCVL